MAVFYCTDFQGSSHAMTRPIRALLNWSHLRHNYSLVRQRATGLAYAVIKADGYGHGLLAVARALGDADGFAVACVDEAMILREGGIRQPIVVLQGAYHAGEWQLAAEHQLQLVLHHPQQLDMRQHVVLRQPVSVWLKINTGMNRLGVRMEQVDVLMAALERDPHLRLAYVLTHFACADEPQSDRTQQQWQLLTQRTWPVPISACNSAALLGDYDINDAISRPGIVLFGSSPFADCSAVQLGLRPVMTLESQIISIHDVLAGEYVGYGGDWQACSDRRMAVVAIGYGDGYPRHAPSGTPVWVAGVECPLVGRVSMDMITVDVTECPQANVGTQVELWGEHVDIDRIARLCDTISYELYCQLTPRVKRVALSQ